MKCPNCGAETTERICPYCDSEIKSEQPVGACCPKCNGTNLKFHREKIGTTSRTVSKAKAKRGKGKGQSQRMSTTTYKTVGVCQTCGHTWNVSGASSTPSNTSSSNDKIIWWILGWVFVFPIPLTILMLRNKTMEKKIKYIIIAAAWVIFLIFASVYGSSGDSSSENKGTNTSEPTSEQVEITDQAVTVEVTEAIVEEVETHLYDNAEIKDAIGEDGKKHGEYVLIKADSNDCTEEAINDTFFNFYKKNNYNWISLIYTDKDDNSGIYFNVAMIQVNAKFSVDDNGVYRVDAGEEPNQIIYTPKSDGTTLDKREVASDGEYHIYNNAIIKNVMNGTRDHKIGEYAIVRVLSEECTEDALADLYFNFYLKHDLNYIAVVYTDRKYAKDGIHITKGSITQGVEFTEDEYGDFSVSKTPDNVRVFTPNSDEQTITEIE